MTIEKVLIITDRLLELLELEKSYLEAREIKNVSELADEKSALANEYNIAFTNLMNNRLLLKQSPVELLDLIEKKTLNLQDAMKESKKHISMLNSINSTILNALIENCNGIDKQSENYTSLGRRVQSSMNKAPALAVSEYI